MHPPRCSMKWPYRFGLIRAVRFSGSMVTWACGMGTLSAPRRVVLSIGRAEVLDLVGALGPVPADVAVAEGDVAAAAVTGGQAAVRVRPGPVLGHLRRIDGVDHP